MNCESHSSAIWRKPKGCEEKTLDCLNDINFINTHELLLNCLLQTPLSFKIIFLSDKIPSRLFHACMLNIITFFLRGTSEISCHGDLQTATAIRQMLLRRWMVFIKFSQKQNGNKLQPILLVEVKWMYNKCKLCLCAAFSVLLQ